MLYKWGVIGHDKQLEKLEKELSEGNVSHAYLFSGPADLGKFHIAQVLSNILQCTHHFCHICEDCRRVMKGIHPDVIEIRDNGDSLKIDEVRALIQKTNLTSTGDRRVVLIENIERMPVEAQNSFLKTLEEPAGNTVFLLTTSQINQVLPTIRSRTRQFSFACLSDAYMRKALEAQFGPSSDLDEILQIAQGRPAVAVRLLKNPKELMDNRNMYNQIEFFLKRNDLASKFTFVEGLDKADDQLALFFDVFSRYLRSLVYGYLNNVETPLKHRFNLQEVVELFEKLSKTRYLIDKNTNKKLALENFFLTTEK